MKFHSLMAVLLLPLLLLPTSGSGATPLPPQAETAVADEAADTWVYRNGDLVLDIRDSAGAEVLRASLAYFLEDEHIATANEAPPAQAVAIDAPQQAVAMIEAPAPDRGADARLPEPLSLGLLGAGIVVLGWTRRQGSQASARSWKQRLVRAIWPWPSLSWLDS
jgi:hypothetical protein